VIFNAELLFVKLRSLATVLLSKTPFQSFQRNISFGCKSRMKRKLTSNEFRQERDIGLRLVGWRNRKVPVSGANLLT